MRSFSINSTAHYFRLADHASKQADFGVGVLGRFLKVRAFTSWSEIVHRLPQTLEPGAVQTSAERP